MRFWVGVSLFILLCFCAANIFLTLLVVPKFEQIYQDALPSQPLPVLTNFILNDRILLLLLAWVWPLPACILFRRQKVAALAWINIAMFLTIAQIVIMIIGLFMLMVNDITGITGMSNTAP